MAPRESFFSATIGGTKYELKKLTLGDARLLKRQFGLEDLDDLNPTDPDQLVGLLFLAKCKAEPERDRGELLDEIEELDFAAMIEDGVQADDAAPEPEGPTGAGGEPAKDTKPGSRAKTPKTSGSQS